MPESTTQEVKALRIPSTMKRLVEALIFAAKEPLSVKQIKAIYEQEGDDDELRVLDADEVRAAIAELNEEFQRDDKPYRIVAIAGGFQFATLSQYAEWLGKLHKEQSRRKLSQSSTETLAIVAYKQPISRPEIESIRGVNCDYVLAALLEKDLVTIVGRAPTPGRPLLYGTTKEFLKHFGLNEITDLPRPREIEEILGESQFETERRMLEAQAGAAEMKKEEEDFKSRLPHIPKRRPDLGGEVKIVQKSKQREIKTVQSDEGDSDSQGLQQSTDTLNDVSPRNQPEQKADDVEPQPQQANHSIESLNMEADLASTSTAAEFTKDKVSDSVEPAQGTMKEINGSTAIISVQKGGPVPTEQRIQEDLVEPRRDQPAAPPGIVEEPAAASTYQEAQESQSPRPKPPSAWHNWKEKIQSFIRKLFG